MELAYALVLLGVIFLYFQLILGRICRWSTNWFVRKGAEASYNLSNMVGTVALGLMPTEHSAAVWILYLTVLNNSMAAYDQDDGLQHLLAGFNIIIFAVRAVISVVTHADLTGAARFVAPVLVAAMVLVSAGCKMAIVRASDSKRCSEEMNKYMERVEANWSLYQDWNASTLHGYRYAVTLEPLTTVEQMCTQMNPLEARHLGKGLCLSFALFRLLFRRYHGLPCVEDKLQPQSSDLVLEGLLGPHQQPGDECRWGFGVVEVQLGFLHDHIHGGYVLWSSRHRVCYYILIALKATLMYIASLALYGSTAARSGREQAGGWWEPHHDPFVALLLLHLFFDLLQIIFYYRSDRWMVSYMCHGHHDQRHRRNCLRRANASLRRLKPPAVCWSWWDWNVYWQNRMGQYSLLEETTRSTACGSIATLLRQQTWDWDSHSAKQSPPVRLPPHLRACIARVLRASNGVLEGVPSLERDHGLPPRELRRRRDANIHKVKVILKWHIATSYCEMWLRRRRHHQHEVAVALSRYCAYLVAFRPELLPCPEGYTKAMFRDVLDEVTALLGDHLPMEDRFHTLERRRLRVHVPEKTVTLSDGLDLGRLLIEATDEDHCLLWEILQNIWVKLILSVAAQERMDAALAKSHVKYLAQGGEFVTQLWALLSNAGILYQRSWPPSQVHAQPQSFIHQLFRTATDRSPT